MSDAAETRIRHAMDVIDAVEHREDFPAIDRVRHELSVMLAGIEARDIPERQFRRVGLARLVTDSWPLGEPVTTAVIEAETAYLGLP
jgi:hypothetical protein